MKIRQQRDDFVVTELDDYTLDARGPFTLYRLEKWDIGTLEAVASLARHMGARRADLSFGGLKDRHAATSQVVSIREGPERDYQGSSFRATCLGRAAAPITRTSFRANRFTIVMRGLSTIPEVAPVARHGIPNYFDDQRFGSLRGGSGEFIGRALVRGDYERALKLALASPDPGDRKQERDREARMAERWGDFAALARELPPSLHRSVAAFLARRPGAFGFAFELIERDLRVLYLEAYQSWLWNRALAILVRRLAGAFEHRYAAGRHAFWASLDPADEARFAALRLPYMTTTAQFEGDTAAAMAQVLGEEGVSGRDFRLRRCRNTFFARGERAARVVPEGLTAVAGDDELNPGTRKLRLDFELPRGSYATLVVKRLSAPLTAPGSAPGTPEGTLPWPSRDPIG